MCDLFPYVPRKGQDVIMEAVKSAVESGIPLVINAPTGCGKTSAVLSSALDASIRRGKKILYTTRTNSQERQVIFELRAISRERRTMGIALQGRRHLCTLSRHDIEMRNSTPEEHTIMCSDRKKAALTLLERSGSSDHGRRGEMSTPYPDDGYDEKRTRGYESGRQKEAGRGVRPCPHFLTLLGYDLRDLKDWVIDRLPTAEEFTRRCEAIGICPYETAKRLIPEADVLVVPYHFAFHPFIRRRLEVHFAPLSDLVLIVDEAHNLPEFAREMDSVSLSMRSLELAEEEAKEFDDPLLAHGIGTLQLVRSMKEILLTLVDDYVYEEDGIVPPHEVETELMARLGLTSRGVEEVLVDLLRHGESIKDIKRRDGRQPRSYLHFLADFLSFWSSLSEIDFVQIVVGGPNPRLEACCLDPSRIAGVANAFHTSIHMSGTLKPLEEYRDSTGLPEGTVLLDVESPFPKEKLKIIYAPDVTTRYEDMRMDPSNLARIHDHVLRIMNSINRSTIVFFPSYSLMNSLIDSGLLERVRRPVFIESRGMSQAEIMALINRFKTGLKVICGTGDGVQARSDPVLESDGWAPVLLSVMGGRIGEGMDFPGEELEIVVIVGLPFPKPTTKQRALQYYYDMKFGRGWEYTVVAPMLRKLLQAIGRLIRDENDRGIAVILDRRAGFYRSEIPDMSLSSAPVDEVLRFWDSA